MAAALPAAGLGAGTARGLRAGLLRPISLWPYPTNAIDALGRQTRAIHVVELSNGQMVQDVKLAVNGRWPVTFYGRMGGMVPTAEELLGVLLKNLEVRAHGAA